jgi:hypothetical protein
MTATFRYLSSTDGYNPVSTQYVIGYVRQPGEFPINRLIQLVPAPAPSFFYYKLDRDQSIRIHNLSENLWADGADRPERRDNQFAFLESQGFCLRYDFNSRVGNIALKMAQSTWKAKQVYLASLASQAMTARTLNLWQGLGTGGWLGLDAAATWPSTNTADANTLNAGAGTWDKAGSDPSNPGTYMAIRKSIMKAVNGIFLQTNGKVKHKDLRMAVSPNLAEVMANTDEIRDAYKYGPMAKEMIEGEEENYNERFGLPKRYAGVEIVVEDSPFLSDNPTANATTQSSNRAYIKADNKAVIMSRPGKIDAEVGPSFSTVQLYWFESQMKMAEFNDPKNEYTGLHATDYYTIVGPALESGFLITNCI